jgi:LuxR family maltose regulon positive regulatory protein
LAQLRARGQLVEIRAADLRFSFDEALAFLQRTMHLSLSNADVATLEQRTEGWVAGLQLAALSMQGQDPERISSLIRSFAGTHRHIFDYLTKVLGRQDKAVRDFIFKTAFLDQLSGPLCTAVTGEEASQEILEKLEAANLFITPLDSERRWYRYHHLFAEFIHAYMDRPGSQQDWNPSKLHLRAAEWYEENGQITEAIDHALQAKELELAARLVAGIARPLLLRGEMTTLMNWLGRLPEGILLKRPELALAHAWSLISAGQLESAVERLELARASEKGEELTGEMTAIRATISAFEGDSEGAMLQARRALDQLPPDDVFLRGIVAANLGIPHMLEGEVAAARRAFTEAATMSKRAGNSLIAVISLCQVAELQIVQGQLHQAAETYREAERIALARDGRPRPMAGMVYAGLGELFREWGQLESAERYLMQAIDLTHRWHTLEVGTFDSYLMLALIRQAQGDPAGALDLIQKAEDLAVKLDAMILDDVYVAFFKARIWLIQKDRKAATSWAEAAGLLPFPSEPTIRYAGEEVALPYHLYELAAFIIARLLLLQGNPRLVLDLLDRFYDRAVELGRTRSVIEIRILQALARQEQGDLDNALQDLEHALVLAEPADFMRIFLDHGEPMATLLDRIQAVSSSVDPQWLNRLYTAAVDRDSGVDDRPPVGLLEALGERELEILRLIAAGLSNREIAEELVLALSTVKWHINNLYGKLGVHSRTQALARGRELDLL